MHMTARTGHAMEGISTLYKYLDATLSMIVPASLILHGWPAAPWGRLSASPKPALLRNLVGVTVVQLNSSIDKLFFLDNKTRHPKLLIGGRFRPAVEASFATLIMYWEERKKAKEMLQVQTDLEYAIATCYNCGHDNVQVNIITPLLHLFLP